MISDGNHISITGIIQSEIPSNLTLNYGFGPEIIKKSTITVNSKNAKESNILGVIWGKHAIENLGMFPFYYKDKCVEIACDLSLCINHLVSMKVYEVLKNFSVFNNFIEF